MTRVLAVAAAGADQPTATTAKIKTASHTEFLTVPWAKTHRRQAGLPRLPLEVRRHLVEIVVALFRYLLPNRAEFLEDWVFSHLTLLRVLRATRRACLFPATVAKLSNEIPDVHPRGHRKAHARNR